MVVGRFVALLTHMSGKYYRRHDWKKKEVVILFFALFHISCITLSTPSNWLRTRPYL